MTMLRIAGALVLWAALLPAHAAERWIGHQTARVSIDTEGRVDTVRLVGSTLSNAMQTVLIERVRRVAFEPAQRNGAPASAEATVLIELEAKAQADALTLTVSGVESIPGYRLTKPPRFPARELRKGISGRVELAVEYDGEGRVTKVAPASADAPMDAFMKAAMKAARDWQFEPERVAGVGLAGSGVIPVTFSIDNEPVAGERSGDLQFPDGGVLRVYERLESQGDLAESQVRVRSIAAAQEAISGS